MDAPWDCIVIGGGAAGLSAALVLGRARRRTLLLDSGGQSNLRADHIGGLLGYDQRPAPELYARGRAELAAYPSVAVRDALALSASGDADAGFEVVVDGAVERAARLVLATGADYGLPEVPGLWERFGRSVFHCPFCHGWEHRGGALGVLDPSPLGALRAHMLAAWSDDVTLFTNGATELDDAAAGRLAAAGIAVEERAVVAAAGGGARGSGGLARLEFADGASRACTGLLVPVTLAQRGTLPDDLGVERQAEGHWAGQTLAASPMGATNVRGVFAAGDCATANPSVANAIQAGAAAAAGVVHDLMLPAAAHA